MESARSTIPGDRNVAQTVLKRRSGYGLRDFSTTQCVKRTHPQKSVFHVCDRCMGRCGNRDRILREVSARKTEIGGGEHRDDDGCAPTGSCSRSFSPIVQLFYAWNRIAGTDGLDISKRRKRSLVSRSRRTL